MGRLLVVLAGLCGIAAVVLPLFDISVHDGADRVEISTLDLARGVDAIKSQGGESASTLDPDSRAALQRDLDASKWIFLGLVGGPALLVLLVGLFSLGSMGRGRGVLALLFGLLALGSAALLGEAIRKADAEKKDASTTYQPGLAVTLLLVTGGAAALGGLLTLIRPTRSGDAPA